MDEARTISRVSSAALGEAPLPRPPRGQGLEEKRYCIETAFRLLRTNGTKLKREEGRGRGTPKRSIRSDCRAARRSVLAQFLLGLVDVRTAAVEPPDAGCKVQEGASAVRRAQGGARGAGGSGDADSLADASRAQAYVAAEDCRRSQEGTGGRRRRERDAPLRYEAYESHAQ